MIEQLKALRQSLVGQIAEIDGQIDRAIMNAHLGISEPEPEPVVEPEPKYTADGGEVARGTSLTSKAKKK